MKINATKKTAKKRMYAVDVFWLVGKSYEVSATSRKDAQKQIQKMVDSGDVSVWSDGFTATEVLDEVLVTTSGEETKNGDMTYFMKPVSIVEG